jgi:hypothetical protein
MVMNVPDKQDAADLLGLIKNNITTFSDHIKTNKSSYEKRFQPFIDSLCTKSKNITLTENSPGGKYTSYTVNKGDEISLCLRTKDGSMHDQNIVMYVTIHELAHVACPEQDHTDLFKDIFVFFLKIAVDTKIYRYTNYQDNPFEYCGMTISENLLS